MPRFTNPFFKPRVVQFFNYPELYCVRKLTVTGWKYLDLWNFKQWRKAGPFSFMARSTGTKARAILALESNRYPAPF